MTRPCYNQSILPAEVLIQLLNGHIEATPATEGPGGILAIG